MEGKEAARKSSYGIDAPTIIRNLFVACAVCLVLALAVRSVTIAQIRLDFFTDPAIARQR